MPLWRARYRNESDYSLPFREESFDAPDQDTAAQIAMSRLQPSEKLVGVAEDTGDVLAFKWSALDGNPLPER